MKPTTIHSQKRFTQQQGEASYLVTFDLDSTVANTGPRQHMIDRSKGTDWDAYSQACVADLPVAGVVTTIRLFAMLPHIEVHGLSARKYSALEPTLAWFEQHEIPIKQVWLDETDMGDYPPGYSHSDYKLERLREVEEKTGKKVILHFDDYAAVAHKFEEHGVPTVCVRTPQEIEELVGGGTLSPDNVK